MAEYEMPPLARSKPEQTYAEHSRGVREWAQKIVESITPYIEDAQLKAFFAQVAERVAPWHDLGKFAAPNQEHFRNKTPGGLPLDHQDAGAAYFNQGVGFNAATFALSMLDKAHHSGLPDYYRERSRMYKGEKDSFAFRSYDPATLADTQEHLEEYIALHKREVESPEAGEMAHVQMRDWEVDALLYRIMFSCLVDADHRDSAPSDFAARPACRWEERLEMLKERQSCAFKKEAPGEDLDREVYNACCEAEIAPMAFLDAPMDEGKIGTLVTYGLRTASIGELKHVFLVVPKEEDVERFADAIRAWVGLSGENLGKVVVSYSANIRPNNDHGLASLWRAPVIVVTLQNFYETVGGNKPNILRKLREVVGSVILFYDCFSDAERWKWPQELEWLKILSETCGCRVLLQGEPTLHFWKLPWDFQGELHSVLPARLQQRLEDKKRQRVAFCFDGDKPVLIRDFGELAKLILQEPGPRLVVLHTEEGAKRLQEALKNKSASVYLALSQKELKEQIQKLKKEESNAQRCATLISAAEIPREQEFTFAAGFIQLQSVAALLRTARLIKAENAPANLYTFEVCIPGVNIREDDYRTGIVLREMLKEGKFQESCWSDLLSEAIRREAMIPPYDDRSAKLKREEQVLNFKQVSERFSMKTR